MSHAPQAQHDPDVYRTLLESTRAIPWKIDWASTKFAYIGPQIEALLGWTPDSWAGVEDWVARIHPDDRERVFNFCIAQSQAGVDHEADYRALHKHGHFVWIRDVVHVVRTADGTTDSLVGFMFDISERKAAEEKIAALQKELETLSYKDGLTGLANRRLFDQTLEQEWAEARRKGHSISLIMLDIDCFKQYNDAHGHIAGDDVLRQVGQCLRGAATRSHDFIARFGGEEFVLVLPDCDAQGARQIADRCRALIFKQQIPHGASSVSAVVTASMGVGTMSPKVGDDPKRFVERVDAALYQAKRGGRDAICAA